METNLELKCVIKCPWSGVQLGKCGEEGEGQYCAIVIIMKHLLND